MNANLPNTQAYNYKATQSITFTPPFSFQAKGVNSLRASIDPLNLTPNPFSDYINGGSNSRIVGKIGDQFEISPSGQASYEIPIKVPGGTGGMVPNLSIVYNSAAKNGLLGYGFELAGLSVINRAPQNLHVDGNVTAVNFTTDDKIMLDGNRLIRLSPISVTSNIEYRTENNTFAKIISSTNPSNSNAKFTVYTKDGLKYEYNSNHDLLTTRSASVENQDLFWTLTKVTDTKGNYFTILYNINKENKEYTPNKIEYTGNDGAKLSPYCSVQFAYEDQPFAFTSFLSGMKITKSKNLKGIEVYYGTTKVKSYELAYLNKNNTKLLSSVTEVASDGKKLNPTTFDWVTVDDLKIKKGAFNNDTSFDNAQVYPGDFNGDGKMDFITIPKSKAAAWRLYLSTGSSFTLSTGNFSNNDIKEIYVGDFNGDGVSDMLVKRGNYSADLYLASVAANGMVSFTLSKADIIRLNQVDFDVRVGDFNGDGVSDILYYIRGNEPKRSVFQLRTSKFDNGQVHPLSAYTLSNIRFTETFDRIEIIDFNGDGLSDIIHIHKNGFDLYKSEGTVIDLNQDVAFTTLQSEKRPTSTSSIIFGDFNGDGKTDLIAYDLDDHNNFYGKAHWYSFLSNGIMFQRQETPIFSDEFKNYPSDYSTYIADINGDGFDDLLVFRKASSDNNNTPVNYFINNGNGINFIEYDGYYESPLINIDPYIADFNGDGRPDILTHYSKSKNKGYALNLTPSGANNLLSDITDGLGNKTTITYKPMSDKSVHEQGKTSNYPLNSFNSSWYLVDKVTQSNGLEGYLAKHINTKMLCCTSEDEAS